LVSLVPEMRGAGAAHPLAFLDAAVVGPPKMTPSPGWSRGQFPEDANCASTPTVYDTTPGTLGGRLDLLAWDRMSFQPTPLVSGVLGRGVGGRPSDGDAEEEEEEEEKANQREEECSGGGNPVGSQGRGLSPRRSLSGSRSALYPAPADLAGALGTNERRSALVAAVRAASTGLGRAGGWTAAAQAALAGCVQRLDTYARTYALAPHTYLSTLTPTLLLHDTVHPRPFARLHPPCTGA
jgi:hypothetical protein